MVQVKDVPRARHGGRSRPGTLAARANGVDPVLRDQRGHARSISDVTDDERGTLRDRPIETGREVVEHHDALAGIDERMDHVASDIAGAAGNQDAHATAHSNVLLSRSKIVGK
jgi:hypothetical protein